eukprot:TRINITY_DN73_c0_g3_i2.p1 TRINITY_DN73_c0_g3~~TRINITY_DN73_c0_g3_i2.p1  ORF type:complete len:115 (-),score=15.48 TRINITY_DN73_c0_g3_i2:108-425(-)
MQTLQNMESIQKQQRLIGVTKQIIKKKRSNKCGHPERDHYAKDMCNNCYHKYGRNKKPWRCSHDRLYAHGLCQNCYINNYNKKKLENTKSIDSEQIKSEEQSVEQ